MTKIQLPLFQDKTQLPTGKNHISFSEYFTHAECSWKHKLQYIQKLSPSPPNQFTEFGLTLHNACERYLLNHNFKSYNHQDNIDDAHEELNERFENIGFDDVAEAFETGLDNILRELPNWLNTQFPGWKLVAAETLLFEPISGHQNKYFKGFADSIIKYPKPPRKGSKSKLNQPIQWEYYILDWKGTEWGWKKQKKMDSNVKAQLVLYKHFLCEKLNLNIKEVKCSFVLCKRKPPKNQSHFELLPVSAGETTINKTLEKIDSMLISLEKKLYKKNIKSCMYCTFKSTQHCPGS